ncbi:hypothetical protein PanWU01x14_010970, partial [Parasponia andersonii]
MARENIQGGTSCAIECLPADLDKDRTIGNTSCNKMLADAPRKRTRRNELCDRMLA